jgi:nucleotide-binding universal stress UspA family protein
VIERVLAALDGSVRAPAVFDRAAELAVAHDARLHLLRVVEVPAEFPPAAHVGHPDALVQTLRRTAEHDLLALSGDRAHLVNGFAVVLAAEAWRAILDVASSLSADLLVIGTHGRHGFERILGTTASRIINHVDRDLVIVHPRAATSPLRAT